MNIMLSPVGVCVENDAMSPDSKNKVVASSNYGTVHYLKNADYPRWRSNPEEDGDEKPTVTVTVSDEDAFIEEIFVNWTKNVDYITIYVVDASGNEVSDFLLLA